jgi:arylsulfatase A-like enzyme
MLRRTFLASAASALGVHSRAAASTRHLLFLAIDDLNDWVGSLGGHPQARTPNLDRLAARSVVFTNAHCAAPLCNPSRATILTGLRPSTTGVYDNSQPFRLSEKGRNAVTLPQHFREHGYRAIGAGKIYHGPFPDPQSWDDYGFYPRGENSAGFPNPPSNLNGLNKGNFDWGPIDRPDDDFDDGKVVQWTTQQLSGKLAGPTFLACGIYRPHLPWYVPRKYYDLFPLDSIELPAVQSGDLDDVPPIGRKFALAQGDHAAVMKAGKYKEAVRAYLASIAFADACLGRVLRALETGPNSADFSIVLWSDHGWHLGEKLHWRKFTLWEESTRSVLMISAQPRIRGNTRCSRAVSYTDLYPTITELCGLPARDGLDGRSFLPLLSNHETPWNRKALTTYLKGNHAVRDERWRYIRYADGSEELYDHSTDPMEWTNIASDPRHAGTKASLARWLPESDAPDSPRSSDRGAAQ